MSFEDPFKSNPALSRFYNAYKQSLSDEFDLTRNVALGRTVDTRKRLADKVVSVISNAVGLITPLINKEDCQKIVEIALAKVVDELATHRNKNIKTFHYSIFGEPKAKLDATITHFAYEATISWAPAISWIVHQFSHPQDALPSVAWLGHMGALRTFEYFITYDNALDNPKRVVNALLKGVSGAGHDSVFNHALKENLFGAKLKQGEKLKHKKKSNSQKVRKLTAEGFFARTAFNTPDDYWILKQNDFVRKDKSSFNYAKWIKFDLITGEPIKKPTYNQMQPKYGYVQLPNKTLVNQLGFRTHRPKISEKIYSPIKIALELEYRFVGIEEIRRYLKEGVNKQLTFSNWLSDTYPKRFSTVPTDKTLVPIFRGEIDGKELAAKNLDFSQGDFSGCDFSHCYIHDCTLGKLNQSRLVGTRLVKVTASGDNLDGVNLDLSEIIEANFAGLRFQKYGISLSYSTVQKSNFAKLFIGPMANFDRSYAQIDEETLCTVRDIEYDQMQMANLLYNEKQRYEEDLNRQKQEFLDNNKELNAKITALAKESDTTKTDLGVLSTLVTYQDMRLKNLTHDQHMMSHEIVKTQEGLEELRSAMLKLEKQKEQKALELAEKGKQKSEGKELISKAAFHDVEKFIESQQMSQNPWLQYNSQYMLNRSGAHGVHGLDGPPGANGSSAGQAGTIGQNGTGGKNGVPARDIDLTVQSLGNDFIFIADQTGKEQPAMLPMLPYSSIHTFSNGGNGGKGGNGGHGGHGAAGVPGQDATRSGAGTSGGPGGSGSNGGNGALGGDGANGGNITFRLMEDDMDLATLVRRTTVTAGQAGAAGFGGVGGNPGAGGAGGASYSYKIKEQSGTDSNGNATYKTRTMTNPGGADGTNGSSGQNGQNGTAGRAGTNGAIQFLIFGQNGLTRQYNSIYYPRLMGAELSGSNDGIIEPGESLVAYNIVVTNVGQMPTPTVQPLKIGLQPHPTLAFNDQFTLLYEKPIRQNEQAKISKHFPFKVKDLLAHRKPAPYIENVSVGFYGQIARVESRVHGFDPAYTNRQKRPSTSFQVRYPVELSPVSFAPTLVPGEQVPVVFSLRNISTLSTGYGAKGNPRILAVNITATSKNVPLEQFQWRAAGQATEDSSSYSLAYPVNIDVNNLAADKQQQITHVITLPSKQELTEKIPGYSRVTCHYVLELGDLNEPLNPNKTHVIQKFSMELQIAKHFKPVPKDKKIDMLLVINAETPRSVVQDWKKMAKNIGLEFRVWNASLYGGFSYFDTKHGQDFPALLKNSLVILCNNHFRNDLTGEPTTILQLMNKHDIYEAARELKTRTLIVGSNKNKVDFDKLLTPNIEIRDKDKGEKHKKRKRFVRAKSMSFSNEIQNVGGTSFTWRKPKEEKQKEKFDNRQQKLVEELSKKHPGMNFHIQGDFKLESGGKKFKIIHRSSIGNLVVLGGLPSTRAHILLHTGTYTQDNTNLFCLFKLMPFKMKLNCLNAAKDNAQYNLILLQAILSDLLEELEVFSTSKKQLKPEEMEESMVVNDTFGRYSHFSQIISNKNTKDNLVKTLIDYQLALDKSGGKVTKYCQAMCSSVLENIIGGELAKSEFSKAKKQLNKDKDKKKEKFAGRVKRLSDPYQLNGKPEIQFDHWHLKTKKGLTIPDADTTVSADRIKMNRFKKSNPNTQTLTQEAIGQYAKVAQFDSAKITHFLNKPSGKGKAKTTALLPAPSSSNQQQPSTTATQPSMPSIIVRGVSASLSQMLQQQKGKAKSEETETSQQEPSTSLNNNQ